VVDEVLVLVVLVLMVVLVVMEAQRHAASVQLEQRAGRR
jgi:hypothetical protein